MRNNIFFYSFFMIFRENGFGYLKFRNFFSIWAVNIKKNVQNAWDNQRWMWQLVWKIHSLSFLYILSNTYNPTLSCPCKRTTLVARSLTKQEMGWNSKDTWLSLANFETLRRFLMISGTYRSCFWGKWIWRNKWRWKWCMSNVVNRKAFTIS